MSKAELCPVCGGTGKYREKPNGYSTSATSIERTCHGCGGKGWVEVGQYDYPYYPDYPQPNPWQQPTITWCNGNMEAYQ